MPVFSDRVDAYRSTIIRAELWRCGGNVSEAARNLGMHRNTIERWLDRLRIPKHPSRKVNGNHTMSQAGTKQEPDSADSADAILPPPNPDAEPDPFCVRATDPFALSLIRLWISSAAVHKIPAEKIKSAERKFYEVARWQRTHGTKQPD